MEMKKKFVVNAAFYGIIALLVIAGYKYILPILTPFLIGFCVASLARLPLNKMNLKTRQQNRWAAIGACVVFYAVVLGLLGLVGAKLVKETGAFLAELPDLFQNELYPYFSMLAQEVRDILGPIDSGFAEMIVELGRSLIQSLGQLIKDFSALAVKWVANGAISIPNAIIQIVITVVSSFYIAIDYRKVLDFFAALLPASKRGMVVQTLQYMRSAVVVYIKSYTIIFFMTFAELAIGLALLKIRYAVPVAMGIAVFDLMPVLGTGGILLPWIVVSAILGDFGRAIGIAVLYVAITAVRNTVEPRLVGDQIGLHPLATLVAMILGLKLIGLLGMFLFPVTLVAVMNLKGKKAEPEGKTEEAEMKPVPAAEEVAPTEE